MCNVMRLSEGEGGVGGGGGVGELAAARSLIRAAVIGRTGT